MAGGVFAAGQSLVRRLLVEPALVEGWAGGAEAGSCVKWDVWWGWRGWAVWRPVCGASSLTK